MKKKLPFLFFALFIIIQSSSAQKKINGSVTGILSDTSQKEFMANATILVTSITDTSIQAQTLSNKKGYFFIQQLAPGNYNITISFLGYETIRKKFIISASGLYINMGIVIMRRHPEILSEVVIEKPPVILNGDTIQFSADAYKTPPNAVAEDLLKKLPGVDVDMNGNVTAQGEAIQKIYVDGKEFFGSDPKMATKNIPADMIESVQVYDDMSENARFTKIDDGTRIKTINIKLKKKTRQGFFGRGSAGYGNDNLYSVKGLVNRFYNDRRISILGASNNINQQGFTSRDLVSTMGGLGAPSSSGNGISTSNSTGINYTDIIGKVQLQGSYMYSETKKNTIMSSYRNTLFPADSIQHSRDSSTYATDERKSYDINRNHTFNLRLEYDIDSMSSILLIPNLALQNSSNYYNDSNITNISVAGQNYLGLTGISKNVNERKGLSFNNELLYRKRFFKQGRTFTIGFRNSLNNSNGSGKTFSPLTFYNPDGTTDSTRQKDFLSSQTTHSSNYVLSSSYTEPLWKNSILELNYAYTNNLGTSDRTAYSFNNSTKEYDSLNPQQTNYFKNKFIAQRVGVNFRYNNNGYNFQIGTAIQAANQDNQSIRGIYTASGKDTVIRTKQSYINFFPTANFRYEFSKRKNIRLSYNGRTTQPNVSQLQDVRDETSSLRTVIGNPLLKQEFNNRINVSYRSYSPVTFRYINMNVNVNQTTNKIVNSIDFDTARGKGVQLIKPVNLNGVYSASYYFSAGIPLRKGVKGSSINFSNRMNWGQNVSQLYGRNNYTNSYSVSQALGLNFDLKEKLITELRASVSYNSVRYSVQKNSSNILNTKYFSQDYSANVNYFILKNIELSTYFRYTISSGYADGYNVSTPLWNGAIAWQLFAKKNGEIKFSVNDILNQNSNIDRNIGENYISDSRTVILQRYCLLTFTYNFNRFGPKGFKKQEGEMRMQSKFRNNGRNRNSF